MTTGRDTSDAWPVTREEKGRRVHTQPTNAQSDPAGAPHLNSRTPSPLTDADLVALCRAQHPDAWEQVYRRYWHRIYSYTYQLLGCPDDADDLATDTFVKVRPHLAALRPDTNLNAWLHRAAQNRCLDVLRRRQRVRWEAWDDYGHDHLLTAARPPERPEDAVEQAEEAALVMVALARCTPRHREALVLREVKGLSCEEIGRVMGCSRSATKSRLFRSREEFRRHYAAVAGLDAVPVPRRRRPRERPQPGRTRHVHACPIPDSVIWEAKVAGEPVHDIAGRLHIGRERVTEALVRVAEERGFDHWQTAIADARRTAARERVWASAQAAD